MNIRPAPSPWERFAGLKPRLKPHVEIHRHLYRGRRWYVLRDRATTRYFRFGPWAYQLLGLLDGSRTVAAAHEALAQRLGAETPDREQTADLLLRLHGADLLDLDRPPDVDGAFQRRDRARSRARWGRLLRPLAQRFPLFDPDALLGRLLPFAAPFLGRAGFALWLATVALAGLVALSQGPALAAHWESRALDPLNLLMLWLLYPVVKLLHEVGHGLVIKARGGDVHEMGIMLLVLIPVPYVDASAASAFGDKTWRMAVGAAGIMTELLLAALALFLWLAVQPGLVRDAAFGVMVIGGISTLLFNGNPLLRFDGYYVLADALEIPNLATRSNRYLGYLFRRHLLGMTPQSPASAPGERPWFVVYGIASFVYRIFILIVIALFIAGEFFFIGALLAVWVIIAQLVVPLGRHVAALAVGPEYAPVRSRAVGLLVGTTALAGLALFAVPLPSHTVAEGILRVPEQDMVRAGATGRVAAVLKPYGARVAAGDPLLRLEDLALDVRLRVLAARLDELAARITRTTLADRTEMGVLEEQQRLVQEEYAEALAEQQALLVRSPAAGHFSTARLRHLEDRWVKRGELLGYITDHTGATARVVVEQADVDRVRTRTRSVEAVLRARPFDTLKARVLGEVPQATDRLPSAVLGSREGGAVAVDARDASGVRTMEDIFQLELQLPLRAALHLGSRVLVRFHHPPEPLAHRGYRALRRLFLGRFEI